MPVGFDRLIVGQEASGPFGSQNGVAVGARRPPGRNGLGEVIGECVHVIVQVVAVHGFERLTDLEMRPYPP